MATGLPQMQSFHTQTVEVLRTRGLLSSVVRMISNQPATKRAKYLRAILMDLRLLPLPSVEPPKDATISAERRAQGNRLYISHHNLKALENYNAAIAFAPSDSPELALAYGNRSAVLLSLDRPEECLKDISKALDIGYEDSRREKLLKRRDACAKAAAAPPPDPAVKEARRRVFKSPTRRHPNIPCASADIEVAHDHKSGRKVVASIDLLPGRVLAVERPYVTNLFREYTYLHCYECCEKHYALMPCDYCGFVMYCSETCKKASWTKYHRHECRIVSYTHTMGFTKIELLALRVVFKARSDFDSWASLREAVDDAESQTNPLSRGFVTIDGCKTYDSAYYAPIHSLETNDDKRCDENIFQTTFAAAVLLDLLIRHTDFFESDSIDVELAGNLLLRHIMTAACNMHAIDGLIQDEAGSFVNTYTYAAGAFAFLSLLNHSCNPNVIHMGVGTFSVLLCLRPIRKGEEILDSYGPHYAFQSFVQRLEDIDFRYNFRCHCEACANGWSTNLALPSVASKAGKDLADVCKILTPELRAKLQLGDHRAAIDNLDDLYKCVTVLEKYIPCKELIDYQEAIKQCWGLLGNIFYLKK